MAEFRGIEDGFLKNIACEEMTISNTELFFPKYIGGYDISGSELPTHGRADGLGFKGHRLT